MHNNNLDEVPYRSLSNFDLSDRLSLMKERFALWDYRKAQDELQRRVDSERSKLIYLDPSALTLYALACLMEPKSGDVAARALKEELLLRCFKAHV